MKEFIGFLKDSYTAFQATENAAAYLKKKGFLPLAEQDEWNLRENGKYYVTRDGSALIAFTLGKDGRGYKIVASHTDSPCFKLKENAALSDAEFTRLNVEPYGGGLYYTFFDRPLKIAGRAVYETERGVRAKNFVSAFRVTIPSLAIHMNREANENFRPDPQTDLLPLLATEKKDFAALVGNPVSADLFAVCDEAPFESGADGEFLSAPRIDNLLGVYASLRAIAEEEHGGICVAVCLDGEEIGSRVRSGAGGDFLASVLRRISAARGFDEEAHLRAISSSFLVSMDNAHALHPNRPEKCDPTNRAKMGGGIVIKGHAGGAYTSNALSAAAIKTVFSRTGVRHQTFYNRSDMRSGSTLGAISLGQVSVPSVDLGIAQLAMHSAVETIRKDDYSEAVKGLNAFFASAVEWREDAVSIE